MNVNKSDDYKIQRVNTTTDTKVSWLTNPTAIFLLQKCCSSTSVNECVAFMTQNGSLMDKITTTMTQDVPNILNIQDSQ